MLVSHRVEVVANGIRFGLAHLLGGILEVAGVVAVFRIACLLDLLGDLWSASAFRPGVSIDHALWVDPGTGFLLHRGHGVGILAGRLGRGAELLRRAIKHGNFGNRFLKRQLLVPGLARLHEGRDKALHSLRLVVDLGRQARRLDLGRSHLRERTRLDALGDRQTFLPVVGDGVEHLHQRHDSSGIGCDGLLGILDRASHRNGERIGPLFRCAQDRAVANGLANHFRDAFGCGCGFLDPDDGLGIIRRAHHVWVNLCRLRGLERCACGLVLHLDLAPLLRLRAELLADPLAGGPIGQFCGRVSDNSNATLDRSAEDGARSYLHERIFHGVVAAHALLYQSGQRSGQDTTDRALDASNRNASTKSAKCASSRRRSSDDRRLPRLTNNRDEVQSAQNRVSEPAANASREVGKAGRARDHFFAVLLVAPKRHQHFRLSIRKPGIRDVDVGEAFRRHVLLGLVAGQEPSSLPGQTHLVEEVSTSNRAGDRRFFERRRDAAPEPHGEPLGIWEVVARSVDEGWHPIS